MRTEIKMIFERSQRLFPILSFICLLIMAGCMNEHNVGITPSPPSDYDIAITVTVSGTQAPTLRSMADGNGEAAVSMIDVLVFAPGATIGSPDVLLEHVQGTGITQSSSSSDNYQVQFHAQLTINPSASSMVILANVPNVATTIGPLTAKNYILEAFTYASSNSLGVPDGWKWNTTNLSNYDPVPMYGEIVLPSGGITDGMNITGGELTRMLARIDVVNNATSDFILSEVHVVNYHTAGYIAPAWSTDGTLQSTLPATPMIPSTANQQIGTNNAMKYAYAGYNGGNGIYGEIYTYEAAATTGVEGTTGHMVAACLILEGTYLGDGGAYFYRVDFTAGEDAAGKKPGDEGFNHSTVGYMPLYRNHRYTMSISAVKGIGYTSADAALHSLGVMNNLKTELFVVDESGITNTVFNGQYYLGLGSAVELDASTGNTARVKCTTNYVNGWQIDNSMHTNGIEFAAGDPVWLKAEKDPLAASVKTANLLLETLLTNTTVNDRVAYIHLKAERLTHKLKVTQKKIKGYWAGSNIYWNGTTLTFDDVDVYTNEEYQGVFFQWGSLWGISPVDALSSAPVYKPNAGGTGYEETTVPGLSDIPYCDVSSTPNDRDSKYLTEIDLTSAHTTGKGDICKYLTELGGGTLHGKKWRMPTSREFDTSGSYTGSGTSWSSINIPTTADNVCGRYRITDGRTKAELGMPFFPASGRRNYGNGNVIEAGQYGYYWSASPRSGFGYNLEFGQSSSSVKSATYDNRDYCFPVRCVIDY